MDEDNNEDVTLSGSNEEINNSTRKAKNKAKDKVKRYKRKRDDKLSKKRKDRDTEQEDDGGARNVIDKIKNRNKNKDKNEEIDIDRKKAEGMEKVGEATEKAGEATEAAGKGMQAAGKGMQAAGKGLEKGGEAIAEGSQAAGEALAAIPYVGAPLGAAVSGVGTVAGRGTQAVGMATDKAGEATEKAGEATEKAGQEMKETGKDIKDTGKEGKKRANRKRKKKKKVKKGLVRSFVLANIVPISIIVAILIFIIFLTGIILFFITMPGMILGKIDDWGREILGNMQGIFTGDSTTAKVSAKEVVNLAEHLERMGYDVQAYGLGTVKYKDDGKTTSMRNGKAQEIEEITKNVEGKEYLRSYIAANENTYVLSQYSIMGAFTRDIHNIQEWFSFDKDKDFTSAEDYSTGMIDIIGSADDFWKTSNSTFAEINRDTKQLKIYSDAINLGPIGAIKQIFTGNPNIQWGEAFSYDLNNWVGRYGRPTELSLALHLSTMMPDLPYEIATGQDFNTKVKIGLMDTTVVYEVSATKGSSTIKNDKIKEYYDKYCSGGRGDDTEIPGTKWTKAEIVELKEIMDKGEGNLPASSGVASMPFSSVMEDNGNFKKYALSNEQLAQLTYVAYREQGTDAGAAAEASLMANLYEQDRGRPYGEVGDANGLVNYVLNGGWFAAASTGSSDYDSNHMNIVKQVLVNGKRTLPVYVDEHDCLSDLSSVSNTSISNRSGYIKDVTIINNVYGATYTFYEFPGGEASGTDPFGYTSKYGSDFCYKFDDIEDNTGGINIKWPFIAEVTNHWFYEDIDFTKDVYRFAKSAVKEIDYKPEDEDDVLNKNEVEVKLNASLGSNQGIIYQVAEPETKGPNEKIKELFTKEYYKYDGTIETAKKIENARAIDSGKNKFRFNGEEIPTDKSSSKDIKKEKVDFKENKVESLAAFGILGNMHTEASDYIYRNLKELMIDLKYFQTAELTEDLRYMLLWPIKTNNQNRKWNLKKDEKNFGTVIECEEGEVEVVAPSEAKIKKIKGNEITLEFLDMSDESYELLNYIYQYKDPYKKVNREWVTGMKLKIKGVKIDGGIKEGQSVKRGEKLGTADGNSNNKQAITLMMYNLDKSVVEDINEYFIQRENTKYEEIMKAKKDLEYTEKEGLDITQFLYGLGGGSSSGANITALTQTPMSREEFIQKSQAYSSAEFAQYAGTIYDVCKENKINALLCAAQAWQEQNWGPPNTYPPQFNYWGLGVFNNMQTSIFGTMPLKEYTKKYCDNINQRLRGELGVPEYSAQLKPYSNKFTGGVNTVYDVFDNYAGIDDADTNLAGQAQFCIEYVDGLNSITKQIYGVNLF